MLFYTVATAASLASAQRLGETLKQRIPNAACYLIVCDVLPDSVSEKLKSFDGVVNSLDIPLTSNMGILFGHYLHSSQELCASIKPAAALALTKLTGATKLAYLAPNMEYSKLFETLDELLDNHDIILAPNPELTAEPFNSTQSAYHPGFFAVHLNDSSRAFLNYWKDASEHLCLQPDGTSVNSYHRLTDAAPAMVKNVGILHDSDLALSPLTETGIPCAYDFYENGDPVTSKDRTLVRTNQAMRSAYCYSNPYLTNDESLYDALRNLDEETTSESGLYWDEYQEILNSTSYRVGKKLVDLANRILPKQLFNKLRNRKAFPAETSTDQSEAPIEILPLVIPAHEKPNFSVILQNCKDFQNTYTAIHSIVNAGNEIPLEIILSCKLSEADKFRLEQTIDGLRIMEDDNLPALLATAHGRYAVLADEHLTMDHSWFHDVQSCMDRTKAAIIQTRISFHDGKLYEAGGVLLQNGRRISYGSGTNSQMGCVHYDKEVDCVSLRGTVIDLNAVNLAQWDQSLSPIYGLADLSFQLRTQHKTTMYVYLPALHDRRNWTRSMQPSAPAADAYAFAQKWKDTLLKENIADPSELFLGRDRSRNKKTIFAVDNTIPMYDISAGDRNTYQYYETMAAMGYNLKIVGDDYQRQEPYATYLEQQGIEVVAADGTGEVEYRSFLRDNGRFIDAAYLNRPNNLAKYTPAVQKYTDARIVYCCHDLHFLRELREHELNGNRKEAQRVREYAKEEIARMDVADVIFDVSAYEKTILDPHLQHARVEVNPIFIYREFPEFKANFHERKDLLFVGSFRHPANLDGVDWLCKEIMPIVHKSMPDVKLHLVGAHPTEEIKALANDRIIVHGFLTDEELAKMYRSCRLSIVPLRFGAGVKGKVLEAMYNGLPIVSTSIGTEGIVDIEQCIENTDGTQAFAEKIIALYPNVETLTEMGRTNWQYVKDHLGVEPAMELFRRSF